MSCNESDSDFEVKIVRARKRLRKVPSTTSSSVSSSPPRPPPQPSNKLRKSVRRVTKSKETPEPSIYAFSHDYLTGSSLPLKRPSITTKSRTSKYGQLEGATTLDGEEQVPLQPPKSPARPTGLWTDFYAPSCAVGFYSR